MTEFISSDGMDNFIRCNRNGQMTHFYEFIAIIKVCLFAFGKTVEMRPCTYLSIYYLTIYLSIYLFIYLSIGAYALYTGGVV